MCLVPGGIYGNEATFDGPFGPRKCESTFLTPFHITGQVVQISVTESGQFDISMLQTRLKGAADDEDHKGRLPIGVFSGASNVTGIVTDDVVVTKLIH